MGRARKGALVGVIAGAICGLVAAPSGAAVAASQWVDVPHGHPANQDIFPYDAWMAGNEMWTVGSRRVTLPGSTEVRTWGQRCIADVCSATYPDDIESPPSTDNNLLGISGTSSSDVWAVGYARLPDGREATTTHHFDGATWTIVPNPVANGELYSVSAAAPADVWAVGSDHGASSSVVLRWNGSEWSRVPFDLGGRCQPDSLVDVDSTGKWPLVIGACQVGIKQPRPMIAAYRDGIWRRMHVDGIDNRDHFNSVSWVGNEAWVVGRQAGDPVLTARWHKGDGWDAVGTGGATGSLTSVAGNRTNNVWAVGYGGCCGPIVLHWTGKSWITDDAGEEGYLDDVTMASDGTPWAVGGEVAGEHTRSWIIRRDPS